MDQTIEFGTNIKEKPSIEKGSYFEAVTHKSTVNALQEAARITAKEGIETAFFVSKKRNGDYLVSGVKEGGTEGMGEREQSIEAKKKIIADEDEVVSSNATELLHAHFHPDGNLTPSSMDLYGLSSEFEDSRAIIGIGAVNSNKDISLLLIKVKTLQAPNVVIIDDLHENIADEVKHEDGELEMTNNAKSDLLRILNDSGIYKATIVSLPKGSRQFPEDEMQKLREFFGVADQSGETN